MSDSSLSLLSWNVNGIRAVERKGFSNWVRDVQPDVLCLQEIKATEGQVPASILAIDGYQSCWRPAERKGYSGVGVLYRRAPRSITPLEIGEFDVEGRVQVLDFDAFVLINAYFPNSQAPGDEGRLDYKLRFCNAIQQRCEELRHQGRHVIVCGDYNVAHKPIDLKNPKSNKKNPGYLPEERAWMDEFTGSGYLDTFRLFCEEPGHYTWWTYRFNARTKNVGWRLDYHCVNEEFRPAVQKATIHAGVMGSDHCPVGLELSLNNA